MFLFSNNNNNDDDEKKQRTGFPVPVQYKLCAAWSLMEYSANNVDTNHIMS